jgi:hypothetical protein
MSMNVTPNTPVSRAVIPAEPGPAGLGFPGLAPRVRHTRDAHLAAGGIHVPAWMRAVLKSRIAVIVAGALVLWLSVISQTVHAQTGTLYGYPVATVNAFDTAYWNSQPAPVRALENMPPAIDGPGVAESTDRYGVALALAKQGYTIDVPITVWGWDPYATMTLRQQYGYTWVPSALQSPVYVPPGVSVPGQASYNPAAPPPGSIKVDNAAADYAPSPDCSTTPACPGITPAAPTPTTNAIGPDLGFQANVSFGTPSQTASLEVYSSTATQHFVEAFVYASSTGASYLYHILGTELMSPAQRSAVWIGPLPGGATAPFTIAIE